MTDCVLNIDGREIAISHPEKVLFPDDGITKRDLAAYWARIAGTALPHYRGRPLSMQRFPDGIDGDGFFQKHLPGHFPDWIDRAELPKQDGTVTYVVAETSATLVYLADQGMITPHLGLSRIDRPDFPDRLVIDLDPSDDDFAKVQKAARHVREALERLGACPFVQTTGSRGLHIVLALDCAADFEVSRAFARDLAERLARRHPDILTVEQRKANRGERVFLDVLRNAYGQTSVGPYALRARPGAPAATPLDWDEALDPAMTAQRHTVRSMFRRLGQKDDPWRDIDAAPASIACLWDRIERLD